MELEVVRRIPAERRCDAPMLFVHGTNMAAWAWERHYLPFFLDAGVEVIAMSLRGHGESTTTEFVPAIHFETFVGDVLAVVDSLDSPPILVGSSLGGMLAQKISEHRAVPACILLAGTPPIVWNGIASSFAGLAPKVITPQYGLKTLLSALKASRTAVRKMLFADISDREFEWFYHRFKREPTAALAVLEVGRRIDKEKVTARILALGAERDQVVFPELVQWTQRFYDPIEVEIRIFPGMGHAMMLDGGWREPAEYILRWLVRIGLYEESAPLGGTDEPT